MIQNHINFNISKNLDVVQLTTYPRNAQVMVALTSNLDLLGLFALEKYVSLVIYMVTYSKHDDK